MPLHRLHPRAAWAGSAYNLGNAALLAGALLGLSAGSHASFGAPLAAAASITLFISGILYMQERYQPGNMISGIGALFLAAHLATSDMFFSATLVVALHATPKLLAAVPKFSKKFLKDPDRFAGFAPMVTRIPVMMAAAGDNDMFLLFAALFWLFADFCLTRPLPAIKQKTI